MNFKHGNRARKGLDTVMGDLVHLGYDNFVQWRRVVGIFPADGTEGRRLRARAKDSGRLLNLSGRRAMTAIFIDSGHVLLAAKNVAALWRLMESKRQEQADG